MRPLEGYLILDLAHVYAGPFATQQLAAMGARVIKVEAPGKPDLSRDDGTVPALSDQLHGTNFQAQNAGKESLTLDIAADEGRAIFETLLKRADVLTMNMTARAIDRLGIDARTCRALNQKLIWCAITGYGLTGPRAQHPAYDIAVQAHSGLMSLNGPAGGPAVRIGPPTVDYSTGAQAAMAITAALLRRERTGQGQTLDVAMADCAWMLMSADLTNHFSTGKVPAPIGNNTPTRAAYGLFQARDRQIMIVAYTLKQTQALLELLGLDDRAQAYAGLGWRVLHERAEIDGPAVEAIIATRTAQEWETELNAAHVPASIQRNIAEAVAHPQYAARPVLADVDAPLAGANTRLPLAGFRADNDGPMLDRASPVLGADTDAILTECGLDKAQIAALRDRGIV